LSFKSTKTLKFIKVSNNIVDKSYMTLCDVSYF